MLKKSILITLLFLPLITFADHTPPADHIATDGKMGYEADGLDEWDLAGATLEDALAAFTTKCTTEIPARITARFPQTGLDPADFSFVSRIDSYSTNWGMSYRCYISVSIQNMTRHAFGRWQASDEYFDILDADGNVTISAVDQCKDTIATLEANIEESKLFDRHALITWNAEKKVNSCYVTYLNLKK